MTEISARTKICPTLSTTIETKCKGSDCIAWQHTKYQAETVGSNMFNTQMPGWYKTEDSTTTGYCSLINAHTTN